MKKNGKKLKLNTYGDYKITIGCVNNNKPKAVYINISSWIEPLLDISINYNRVICDINKKIKQQIYNYLSSLDNSQFIPDRTIVDLDLRESGVRIGKRSFMSCDITLFLYNETPITNIELQESMNCIIDNIILSFNTSKYFSHHKTKKEVLINEA